MPAGWLQNYLNTIQTPNTYENRNVIRCNLRTLTRIFLADVTKTRNGEWGMGNGEWGMGNGEWGMGNGKWEIEKLEMVVIVEITFLFDARGFQLGSMTSMEGTVIYSY